MIELSEDDVLLHYGVKGMRWGKRRARPSSEGGERRLSRKEHRAKVKADRNEFYQNKAARIVNESLKNPDTLISLKDASPYATIVTGKEFVDYASRGGVFDINYTDVYARPTSEGYEINVNANERFKAPKR